MAWLIDGVVRRTQQKTTDMQKCSAEFERTQEAFYKSRGMVDRGEVRGRVP